MLRHLPNLLTLLRIALVLPVVVLLLREKYGTALLLFTIAGLSDGLDGYLAKRFDWKSRLGAILDPLADKALLVSSYLALAWLGAIPVWLAVAVVTRDVIIVLGGLAYHMLVGRLQLAPANISRLNTLAQLLLVVVVMLDRSIAPLPHWVVAALIYLVLLTTIASGLNYVVVWGQRALVEGRATKAR
jgi:cardiolipin synthase